MPDLTVALTLYGQSPKDRQQSPPNNQETPIAAIDSHSQYRHHPPHLPPAPPPETRHYPDDDSSYPGTPYEYNQPLPHHHHHHHLSNQQSSLGYSYYPPSPPSPPSERQDYRERRPEYIEREYSNYGSSTYYGVERERDRYREREPYEKLERRDTEREQESRDRDYQEREFIERDRSDSRAPPAPFPNTVSSAEDVMGPLLELQELKFTPRTTAGKHLAKFEKLVSLAYPDVSDGGKWTLFSQTLDAPTSWGTGKATTPGKWLASLNDKRNSMSFEQLKSLFIERWGTRAEREQLRLDRERERDRRDRERDEYLHQQLMHTADLLPPPPLPPPPPPPLAPEASNNSQATELVIQHERDPPKTKVDIQKNSSGGQILLTITDQKPRRSRSRKDRGKDRDRERDRSRAPSLPLPEDFSPLSRTPSPPSAQIEAPPSSGAGKLRKREKAVPGGPIPSDSEDDEVTPILAIEAPPPADAASVEAAPAIEPETSTALVSVEQQKLEELPIPLPNPTRPRLLEGKIAAITGASRGIGRAIALGFAKDGAHIIAHYWGTVSDPANEDILSLANEIKGLGQKCDIVFGDMADPQTSDNIIRKAVETFGRLDIAVGNAGMCWYRDFWDVTPELLRRHVDVNLNGNFFFVQAVATQMRMQYTQATKAAFDEDSDIFYGPRTGTAYGANIPDHSIILVSSNSALAAGPGASGPNMTSHYSPTQAGLLSLMQSSAVGLGRYGIRVNSLLPGTIMTRMVKENLEDGDKRARMEKKVPLGRLGRPRDMVGPAVFLASEQSRYVTGAQLLVDGGAFANLGG